MTDISSKLRLVVRRKFGEHTEHAERAFVRSEKFSLTPPTIENTTIERVRLPGNSINDEGARTVTTLLIGVD